MSMPCKLWLKFKDYLIYDDEGEELGLKKNAPIEAREAYEAYPRLTGRGTAEDRKMKDSWFQAIKPYGIFKGHVLAGIHEDAPSEAKDAYEKLKRSGIRLSESGAMVKF